MTLGTGKRGLKPLPLAPLGRLMPVLGLAAVLGPLAVQAQGTAAPAAVAVSAPAASSVTPTSATPTAATTAKWGEGVLEREFLIKLRTFLETDPFDFKAMNALLGNMEVVPKDGPYPDGSWVFRTVRTREPLGGEYGNRGPGGANFAWNHLRTGSYLRLEFVKMPPAGKRDGDGLPCMTPELIKEVFAAKWVGTTTYTDFSPMYPGRLPYPIPANQIFRWLPDTPEQVFLVYQLNEICVPGLTAEFKKLPPHPAVR